MKTRSSVSRTRACCLEMVGALMTRSQMAALPMRVSPSRSWYAPGIPASTKDRMNNLPGVLPLFDELGRLAGPLLQSAQRTLCLSAIADAKDQKPVPRAQRHPMTFASKNPQRASARARDGRGPFRGVPHRVAPSRVVDREDAVVGDVVQGIVLLVRRHRDA